MRERDLARAGIATAAKQTGIADRVMRRAEGPCAHKGVRLSQKPCGAVNFRRLDGLLLAHRRHDRGDALGDHRLAGTGRPDHQNVVPTGHRDLNRAFGIALAFHVAKVDVVMRGRREEFSSPAWLGSDFEVAFEKIDRLAQIGDTDDVDARDDTGLHGSPFWHQQAFAAFCTRFERHSEKSAHGPQLTVEREFADHGRFAEHRDGNPRTMRDE